MSHTSQSWLGSTSRSSTPRVIVPGATGRRTTTLAYMPAQGRGATWVIARRHDPSASRAVAHAKVSMTMEVYAHVLPDMQKDAAATVGTLLHG
jgi:integrase